MLKMVIFDFDGVISDSEKLHFQTIKEVMMEDGLSLTWETYESSYLGFDDRGSFQLALNQHNKQTSADIIAEMCQRKLKKFIALLDHHCVILPGAKALLADLAKHNIPCGICTGSMRLEAETILNNADMRHYFIDIVTADDVKISKPDPEGYILSYQQINKCANISPPATTEECLVIEDSMWGIASAQKANLKCLAVETTYPANKLTMADHVVKSLEDLSAKKLINIFATL
jgi:HAD superfamily hydrolase (TIGR01509 family)